MLSNFFMSIGQAFDEITAREYKLATEVTANDKFKLSYKLTRELNWRGLSAAVFNQGESVFVEEDPSLPKCVLIDKAEFILSDAPLQLSCMKQPIIFMELLHNAFKQRCKSLGYEFDHRKRVCTEKTPIKSDLLDYYRGFSFDVEVFPDGHAGIWIDPKIVWRQPVNNLLKHFKPIEDHKGDILAYLKGKEVMCYSSTPGVENYHGLIADVVFESIGQHKMSTGETVFDYLNKHQNWKRWFNARKMILSKDDGPILRIKMKGRPELLSIPPQLVEILVELDDSLLENAEKMKLNLGPEQRVKETLRIAGQLFSAPFTIAKKNVKLHTELLDWTKRENQVYGRPCELKPPELIFGGNKKSPPSNFGPNIKYCLSTFGPISQKGIINVSCVCPMGFEEKVKTFFKELNKCAADFHLAGFQILEPINTVEKISPTGYAMTIKRMAAIPDTVTLVIIPKLNNKIYFYAKKELGDKALSSQMITIDFIDAVQAPDKDPNFDKYVLPRLYVMATQMYDKSLKKGESIWHLAKPVGNLDEKKRVYFMGFDVSRNPENHKESAAYAAVCDSLGRVLHRKTLGSHKGERVSSEELRQWFFDAASDAYLETERTDGTKIDEMILFKDGRIRHTEMNDYKKGTEDAKSDLIEHGIMTEKGNIRIISVVKSGPHRIYGMPQKQFLISEAAIVRDNKHAIIVTAKSRKGSPASLRLNIDFELNPDLDVAQLCQMFNELRYLDWSSIYNQPKTILPLHIVQNLAKLSKEDITVPYIPR